jgi:hypothetical protein
MFELNLAPKKAQTVLAGKNRGDRTAIELSLPGIMSIEPISRG